MATKAPDSPAITARRDVFITGSTVVSAPGGTVNLSTGTTGENERDFKALEKLESRSSPDALHTSTAVARQDLCTPGTRTVTLERLRSFATDSDPTAPDILWMHGPAGAGKSAIMRTLAQGLSKDNALLGTFFFFRAESERNTPAPFIPTLALQLSTNIPETQPHIAHSIQTNPTIFSQPPQAQSPHLLSEPLLKTLTSAPPSTTHPLVIIVDGLDECVDLPGQREIIRAMVQLASSIRSGTNRRIKVLIASRPERGIKPVIETLTKSDDSIIIISLDSSDANIELYYDEQLDKIRQEYNLPASWPSAEDIAWLREKTSGQYAFAAVSTRFMAGGDPVVRLQIIRNALKDPDLNLRPFEPLDQLYAAILHQLPPEMLKPALLVLRFRLDQEWDADYNAILDRLLDLPVGCVKRLAPYLSSLMDFGGGLQPYHASLADFLLDPSRANPFSLYVDPEELSQSLARGILVPVLVQPSESRLTAVEEFTTYSSLVMDEGARWSLLSGTKALPPLLENLDLLQYGLWSLSYFFELCCFPPKVKALTRRRSQVTSLNLFHHLYPASLKRLDTAWRTQRALIGEDEMDLVLRLCIKSASPKIQVHSKLRLLLRLIICSNKKFHGLFEPFPLFHSGDAYPVPVFDLLEGFILKYARHSETFAHHHIQILLSLFSTEPGKNEIWAQHHVSSLIHCGGSHSETVADTFQCQNCLSALSDLRIAVLQHSCSLDDHRLPHKVFFDIYQIVRNEPALWNNKAVVECIYWFGNTFPHEGLGVVRPQISRKKRLVNALCLTILEPAWLLANPRIIRTRRLIHALYLRASEFPGPLLVPPRRINLRSSRSSLTSVSV